MGHSRRYPESRAVGPHIVWQSMFEDEVERNEILLPSSLRERHHPVDLLNPLYLAVVLPWCRQLPLIQARKVDPTAREILH